MKLSRSEYKVARSLLLKSERLEFRRLCCRTRPYSSSRFINWLTKHYPDRLYEAATRLGMEAQ